MALWFYIKEKENKGKALTIRDHLEVFMGDNDMLSATGFHLLQQILFKRRMG